MPAWKWGPDNASLKVAVPPTEVTAIGSATGKVSFVAPPVCAVFTCTSLLCQIDPAQMARPVITVKCVLIRGGTYSDIEIPISSYQVFRTSTKINIQVVVPDYSLMEAVADRATASIALFRIATGTGGARLIDEIAIATVTDMRFDKGARNKSVTIQAAQ